MKKKKENLTGYLFILPAIILFLFFVLIPVIAMVCLGFTKYNLFSAPQWTGFSNFAKIFTDGRLWTVTKNTIFLAFFSVILNIVVGLFLALLIANKRSPVFNYLVRLFYFFPLIVAPVYIAVIWSNILSADGGLLNYYIQKIGFEAVGWLTDRKVALKTIIGIEVWRLTGFAMLTFIAGIKNISKDYFEAASLDGAGVVQTAFYITIPQLTPTILLNLIMYVITELKTFDIPMLMTKGEPMDGTRTIAMYIYETAFQKQDMGYACTISLFFVVGIMILTCVQFITSNRWVHYD